MDMTGNEGILSVPSEHFPGLVALVVFPLLAVVAMAAVAALARRRVRWAEGISRRLHAVGAPGKAALLALGLGSVVHAALVPTHASESPVTAGLFALDALGLGAVFVWSFLQRPYWRSASVVALGGTASAYALYLLNGLETADLVGLITTAVELAAALWLLASAEERRRAVSRWSAALALPVALASLIGINALGVAANSATPAASSSTPSASHRSMGNMAGSMGSGGSSTTRVSLDTNSPAGPIVWPYPMDDMPAGMQMVPPNCTSAPTSAQEDAARNLVNQTVQAVAPYQSLAAAKAAGYVPITPPGKIEVHYINYAIARQDPGLDPDQIPSLVYVNTPHGAVLVAAMYLAIGPAASHPPQPGGCLTQWHVHDNLCFSGSMVVGSGAKGGCGDGSSSRITSPMMHVWLVNVPGGPLMPDPGTSAVIAARQLPAPPVANGTA